MADRPWSAAERGIGPVEHELTVHLEKAHELARRARHANDAVQAEIDRALEIADQLVGRVFDRER